MKKSACQCRHSKKEGVRPISLIPPGEAQQEREKREEIPDGDGAERTGGRAIQGFISTSEKG